MKKRLLCLTILCTIALTGCRGAQADNTQGTETESQSTETQSETESEAGTESKLTKKAVSGVTISTDVEIPRNIDDIKDAPDAERFYEDDTYEYYFLKPMSAYVTVEYEDGTSENIKDAFANGHVEVRDIRKEQHVDIFVKTKNPVDGSTPKLVNIAFQSGARYVETATETFYREGKYRYSYSMGYSSYIYAYYTDGTRENIRPALREGRITIEDMQAYGFGGAKSLDIKDIVDLTLNGDVQCVQEREEIYEGTKYKYYLDSVKSKYIELHYMNGEKETLRELVDAGELTEEIMMWIRNWDVDGLKREKVPSPIKEILHSYNRNTPIALDIKEVRKPELLYEDEKYQYYLEFPEGNNVIVNYENGTSDHYIETALKSGRVTIYDLGKEGMGCFVCEKNPTQGAKPSLFYIVDSKIEDNVTNGMIYEDDTYEYRIIGTNIDYIYAYYTNGTREPIADALKAGRISIADLDTNGIEYSKKTK